MEKIMKIQQNNGVSGQVRVQKIAAEERRHLTVMVNQLSRMED
jgi:hypothetical protein